MSIDSPFLERTTTLLGACAMARLQALHLFVVGLGAVGGAAVEALARSGVGRLTLMDGDTFVESNLNRQPFARLSTLGQPKAYVTAEALKDIAPQCEVHPLQQFLKVEEVAQVLEAVQPDVVLDAIDDVPAKLELLKVCHTRKLPIWSSMGAARKCNPAALCVGDISKSQVCPLARSLRQGLRKAGITKGIRCVWSEEVPAPHTPERLGSFMPVTASAGLLLAADLISTVTHCRERLPEQKMV